MKHILFPTDFSENAHNAFRYALRLANFYNARISSIHVAKPSTSSKGIFSEKSDKKTQTGFHASFLDYQQEAHDLRDTAELDMLTDIEVKHILKEGDFVSEMLKLIEAENIDFVVMGTQGAGNLKEVFLGTNTSHFLREAPCPVLIVPNTAKYKPIKKMAYAMGIEWFEDPTIDQALEFARFFGAELSCFNVQRSNTLKMEDAEDRMSEYEFEYRSEEDITFKVIGSGDTLLGIHRYLEENELDLLCMLYHKRGRIADFLFSNYVNNMALGCEIPLLIFRDTINT